MRPLRYWKRNGVSVLHKISKFKFGIFEKISGAFIVLGLVPLLVISIFFLDELSKNVNHIVLNDGQAVLQAAVGYVDAMLEEWETCTEQIYLKKAEQDLYLKDIFLDEELTDEEKALYVRKFLVGMESVNGLKSIRFLDAEGNLAYVSETVGKVQNTKEMEKWKVDELAMRDTGKDMMLVGMHDDIYFSNSNDSVITVERNLFDTSNLKTVDRFLGTIYLDIGEEAIGQQLSGIAFGNHGGFLIIDRDGGIVYQSGTELSVPQKRRMELAEHTSGAHEDSRYYYLCRENQSGGWISVICIHKEDVQKNIAKTRQYILTLLIASTLVLLILYIYFSKRVTQPVYLLRKGMESIQSGNLETRVQIERSDEFGVLAAGLNQMAEQLSEYIDRVYGAEIKQREAELNVLKSQIKPHYLYNTLDVIRMTAVGNEDRQTAEMIESLARQLRYLMGQSGDMVTLQKELDNVMDYFMTICIRYENQMDLKLSVPDKLKKTAVLKLILQPVVENAVKHGLAYKKGRGTVWVSAEELPAGIIEITIMDDGVGMEPEKLEQLRRKLESGEQYGDEASQKGGIGVQNVNERIQNKYGKEFGLKVESTLGMGTIVMIRIPDGRENGRDELQNDPD